MEEYIKLLDLPDEFDFAILKKAYRKKVMIFHPDKAKDEAQRAEFEAMMKKLNAANDYLKEYLERHDGKYTKPVEEDIKEETEEETEDYSDADDYDEPSMDEEPQEESIYEEEYEEDVEHSEILNEDEIRDLSLSEKVKYVLKVLFTPRLFYLALKKSNEERPFTKEAFIVVFIVVLLLMWYDSTTGNSEATNNHISKQEIIQDNITDRQNPEATPEPNKQLSHAPTGRIEQDEITNNEFSNSRTESFRESDFEPYMRELQHRIKRNWEPPKLDDSSQVVMVLKIAKDGRLLSYEIQQSSGIQSVDESAIKALKQAAPFKPLPYGFNEDSIDIEFTFDYHRFE